MEDIPSQQQKHLHKNQQIPLLLLEFSMNPVSSSQWSHYNNQFDKLPQYLQVPALIKYPYLCITSSFVLKILAIAAPAATAALLPVLEALAVLLETSALDAVAGRLTLLDQGARTVDPPVLAPHAPAGLPTGLPRPVALAILGLAVRFDASASDSSLGGHPLEQIIDLSVSFVGGKIRQSMALAGPRANVDAPRKLSSTQSMSNQHQREQVVALSFKAACFSRQRESSRFMPINYPLNAHLNPNGSKTVPHLQTHTHLFREILSKPSKTHQKWQNSTIWKVLKESCYFYIINQFGYERIMQSKIFEGWRYATGLGLYIFYYLAVSTYNEVYILLKGYVKLIIDNFGCFWFYQFFRTCQ